MNVRGMATATLGLGAAAEALRYTPKRDLRLPLLGAIWGLHVITVLLVAMRSRRVPVPGILGKLGTLLAMAGGALAFYSAIIEHTREGRGHEPDAAAHPALADVLAMEAEQLAELETPLRDGTYRASRHPAVLGYAMFLVGLALMTRSIRVLMSLPLWIAAAIGQSALSEEALRRRYNWYDDYARSTPMLIPTKESAKAAMEDLKSRFASNGSGNNGTPTTRPS